MGQLVRNIVVPGKYNNYLLGGNLCNAFAMGEIGASDEFFLVGCEPSTESLYPLLTGNIMDSEGKVLFRLVRNILQINPGNCSKILGDHIGYEIHDSSGKMIFKISTKYEYNDALKDHCFISTIDGNFFDKSGKLLFQATSGSEKEALTSFGKHALGFSDGFGLVQNYSKDEIEVARIALSSQGTIHQKLTGEHNDRQIDLDGKYIQEAKLIRCQLTIRDGNFYLGSNNTIRECQIKFTERARTVYQFSKLIEKGNK